MSTTYDTDAAGEVPVVAASSAPPGQVISVAVRDLVDSPSPLREVDDHWVAVLAGAGPPFAPIVINTEGRLIDGAHRVRAATILGLATLFARVVVAETDAAVTLAALRANRAQAKALTSAERKAVALQLIATAPELSNRAIARATGSSHSSIAAWRSGATGQSTGAAASQGEEGGQSSTPHPGDAQGTGCDHRSHPGEAGGCMGDPRRGLGARSALRRAWRRVAGVSRRWVELLSARLRRRVGRRR